MTGRFITFEGGEGSGKSTQISLLHKAFETARLPVHRTREPGGSPGAEAVRGLLVDAKANRWDWSPMTEVLLFMAARSDHVEKVIRPNLAAGMHVLCDRFMDSTLVYQGQGKALGEQPVQTLQHLAVGNLVPDLTLILDIDPAAGLKRASARAGVETRFENLHDDFHHAVRAGFLAIASREPQRCAVINADQTVGAIHMQILTILNERLGLKLPVCQT